MKRKNDDGTSEAKKRYDNGKQKIAMGDFQENNQHKSGEKKKKEIDEKTLCFLKYTKHIAPFFHTFSYPLS